MAKITLNEVTWSYYFALQNRWIYYLIVIIYFNSDKAEMILAIRPGCLEQNSNLWKVFWHIQVFNCYVRWVPPDTKVFCQNNSAFSMLNQRTLIKVEFHVKKFDIIVKILSRAPICNKFLTLLGRFVPSQTWFGCVNQDVRNSEFQNYIRK